MDVTFLDHEMFFNQEVPNYVPYRETNCEQNNWSYVKGTIYVSDINSIKSTRDDSAGVVEAETEKVTGVTEFEPATGLSNVPNIEKIPSTSTIIPAHQSLDIPEVIPNVSHS